MSETESEDLNEKSRGSNEEREKEIKDPQMEAYYAELAVDKSTKKTPVTYRETFLKLQDWIEDREDLGSWREMNPSHLSLFQKDLKEEDGLYGTTIDQHLNRLSKFFRDKDREDLADKIEDFETTSQNLYQEKTGEKVLFIDIHEYAEMLEACKSPREELICRTLWETGMRRSELSETTLQKVDREEQLIRVDSKKNDKTRPIPYSVELKPILREWLDFGGRDQYSKAEDSEYLIVTQHSEQVRPGYINKVVRRVADRAGISYSYAEDAKGRKQWFPTAHHFRHSYCTYRVANGMDLRTLSELAGHKSGVEQTARYVGILEDGLKEDNEKYRPKTRSKVDDLLDEL